MAIEVVMPRLSDSMEEGTILKWLKRVGEPVTSGEVIAEVETDKADMELEAAEGGVLEEIVVAEGASAPVGAVIARLGARDGKPAATGERDEAPRSGERERDEAPRSAERKRDEPARSQGGRAPATPVKASPSAQVAARERGIDLARVPGSGPGGRVVKGDVEAYAERAENGGGGAEGAAPERPAPSRRDAAAAQEAAPAPAARTANAPDDTERPVPPLAAPAPGERRELSRMRQSIARRMAEAFRDMPHFYVTAEIDMTEAARLKRQLADSGRYRVPISYTHLIMKATALALVRHPRLNASYHEGAVELHRAINIGMAVAVEDGLIVPVLRDADRLPLAELAAEARRLAEQATQGRFGRDDLSGGTFTVSNMGMLDIEEFAAVLNPPQAAILAVGAIKDRAVVRDGGLAVAKTVRVTVSCDHRIVDGVVAGRFLEELRRILEQPLQLVLDGG